MVYNDEILKEETMCYPERSMHWFVFQALTFVQMCSVFHCLVSPIILAFLCEKVQTFLVYLSSPCVNEFWNCMTIPCVCVCMCMCSVARLCPTLWGPMDYRLPGSSVHGILQTRILEWVDYPSSRGSSQPRNWTGVSCVAGRFFSSWATREALV